MSQKVIIIGGVGSGTVIAQAIIDANLKGDNSLQLEGFMSHILEPGEMIEDIPVVVKQSVENVKLFFENGYKFIFALHRMEKGNEFIDLFHELKLSSEMLAIFVHPTAYVAPNVIISEGSVIMPYVMISSHASIGINTLVMTGATIGHNTTLGKFNHIASQAVVGAYISTGIGAHIGLNATIREYIKIGDFATLGMGAVLTKNIENNEIWAGNPARFLKMAQ